MPISSEARLARLEELEQKLRNLLPYDALGDTWSAGIRLLIQLSTHGPGHNWVQEALKVCRETREEANASDTSTPQLLRQAGYDFCEAVELAVAAAAEWTVVKSECVLMEKLGEGQEEWIEYTEENYGMEEVEVKEEDMTEEVNDAEGSGIVDIEVKEEVEELEEISEERHQRNDYEKPGVFFADVVAKEEDIIKEEEEEYDVTEETAEDYFFDEQHNHYGAPSGSGINNLRESPDDSVDDTGPIQQNLRRKRKHYETLDEVPNGHDYVGANSNVNHPIETQRLPICDRIAAKYLRRKTIDPFGLVENPICDASTRAATSNKKTQRYRATEFATSTRDDFTPATEHGVSLMRKSAPITIERRRKTVETRLKGPLMSQLPGTPITKQPNRDDVMPASFLKLQASGVWKNGLGTMTHRKTPSTPLRDPSVVVQLAKHKADVITRRSAGNDVSQPSVQPQSAPRDYAPSIARPWKLRRTIKSNNTGDRVMARAVAVSGQQAYRQLQKLGIPRAPVTTAASAPRAPTSVTQPRKLGRPPKKNEETGNRLLGRAIAQAGMRQLDPLPRPIPYRFIAAPKRENGMQ